MPKPCFRTITSHNLSYMRDVFRYPSLELSAFNAKSLYSWKSAVPDTPMYAGPPNMTATRDTGISLPPPRCSKSSMP